MIWIGGWRHQELHNAMQVWTTQTGTADRAHGRFHRPKRSAAIATLYGENCRLLLATDGLLTRLAPYRELSTHLASTEQLAGSCAASTSHCQSQSRPHDTGVARTTGTSWLEFVVPRGGPTGRASLRALWPFLRIFARSDGGCEAGFQIACRRRLDARFGCAGGFCRRDLHARYSAEYHTIFPQ